MKTTLKLTATIVLIGFAMSCSHKSENSIGSGVDSMQRVAPTSDGMPSGGGAPANAGSPADSAAQSYDSISNQ